MNRIQFMAATVLVAAIAVTSGLAQRPAVQPSRPPAAPAVTPMPDSKIALIYSQDFQDPKNGIARFTVIFNKLNAEFADRQKELEHLGQRIRQLQDEVNKASVPGSPVGPETVRAKADQLEQLKKDYQRKGEDGQAAYQKRRQEILMPLNEDINKALEAYAKAHGVNIARRRSEGAWVSLSSR